MKSSKRVGALWKLLDLCDELQRIRHRMSDPELRRDARTRLRRESQRKRETLDRDLKAYRFRGPVGKVLRESKLRTEDFLVLSVLLHRYLRSEDPACEGRLILSAVFDSTFEVLRAAEILQPSQPLRASGLVVLEEEQEDTTDILEARFQLSADAIQTFREEVAGGVPEDVRRNATEGYTNNRELLVDLRIVHNLYQLRSERAFNQDRWDRVHSAVQDPGQSLSRRIDAFWARIRRRLESTPDAGEFPVVRFMTEHTLEEEETVIVVHLLFKELYEGNAYADAAALLKLVSSDEADLIRNRRLVLPGSTLRAREIIELEPMLENRELTAEAHLADWVVSYVFGSPAAERRIHADERLDWHLYLQSLEDTGSFFRDLEAN